jgi:hypothetical protein
VLVRRPSEALSRELIDLWPPKNQKWLLMKLSTQWSPSHTHTKVDMHIESLVSQLKHLWPKIISSDFRPITTLEVYVKWEILDDNEVFINWWRSKRVYMTTKRSLILNIDSQWVNTDDECQSKARQHCHNTLLPSSVSNHPLTRTCTTALLLPWGYLLYLCEPFTAHTSR